MTSLYRGRLAPFRPVDGREKWSKFTNAFAQPEWDCLQTRFFGVIGHSAVSYIKPLHNQLVDNAPTTIAGSLLIP
jgi:hypothetical protein